MGHALNKILKDFIVRYKSMSGYCAPYVPGWDTHGLPIEQALTNKGVKRKEMSLKEFRELCAKYALEQIDNQRTEFKRLGVRGDWENPYITLLSLNMRHNKFSYLEIWLRRAIFTKVKSLSIGLHQVNLLFSRS